MIDERTLLGKNFRIYNDVESPLFLAKDIAEGIKHSDVSTMIRTVDEDEKLTQTIFVSGQNRECWFLTGKFQAMMDERISECVKKAMEQLELKILEKIQMLAQQGLENHRPSHKTKLDWNKVIKTYSICKGDEEALKQFVLVEFNADKWEDIPYYRNFEVLGYIRYLAEKLKMFTQVSIFDSQSIN